MLRTGDDRIYFKGLDALRFLAFINVFIAHVFDLSVGPLENNSIYVLIKKYSHYGVYGVYFFFVLSGFLITYLLISEKENLKKVNIPFFYIRRSLRIWPLYIVALLIGFVIVPQYYFAIYGRTMETVAVWPYLMFLSNLFSSPESVALMVLWSIAVEEQFYLVWPFVVQFIPKKFFLWIIIAMVVGSYIWRSFIVESMAYAHTIGCLNELGLGGILAYLCYYKKESLKPFIEMKRSVIVLIYILGTVFFVTAGGFLYLLPVHFTYNQRVVYALFFAFIIFEQVYCKNSFIKLSRFEWLNKLGKMTYGMYIYHFTVIYFVVLMLRELGWNKSLWQVFTIQPIISLTMVLLLSTVSYKYFEKPFLRLKERFRIL